MGARCRAQPQSVGVNTIAYTREQQVGDAPLFGPRAVVFGVAFIEHRAEGRLGRRVRAPRSGNPDGQTSTTLKETAPLKFMNHPSPGPSNRARRRGAAGRMGVLGRRTRGEPTNRLSERTSQPPPSTTSGHCMRVRPGSPITYVHDKVVVLKPPARACPPGGLVPSPYRLHGDLNGTRHSTNVFASKASKPYFHLFTIEHLFAGIPPPQSLLAREEEIRFGLSPVMLPSSV